MTAFVTLITILVGVALMKLGWNFIVAAFNYYMNNGNEKDE